MSVKSFEEKKEIETSNKLKNLEAEVYWLRQALDKQNERLEVLEAGVCNKACKKTCSKIND